jgi:hypothetical protein
LLQRLLVLGVSLAVYAKPRCSAFIASLSDEEYAQIRAATIRNSCGIFPRADQHAD